MIIKDSKFVISVAESEKLLNDNIPQVAFVGRSNVGKSSLLNFLVNKKALAKTSGTPGRTRLVNYFLINNAFYFVDLPGYGFAKGTKSEVSKWDSLIEPYLTDNANLKCICMLVDCRIPPTELDVQMSVVLNYYRIPYIVIATKADKLSKSKYMQIKSMIASTLSLARDNIFVSSSSNRIGKDEILKKIETYLSM